jgi:hypothetical protein
MNLQVRANSGLGRDLANLLRLYYAYPESAKEKTSKIIDQIEFSTDINTRQDVAEQLSKFENQHLALVKDFDATVRNIKCVQSVAERVVISSFWCQKDMSENTMVIRTRFAKSFIESMNKTLKYLLKHNQNKLIIDLRGNGGGGDAEMELALMPFINDGVRIYDYQFKILTSVHFIARVIQKAVFLFGREKLVADIWDFRRSYYYRFKKEIWGESIFNDLNKIKKRVAESKIELEIVVDRETGSASELFATVLIDSGLGKAVGTKTKGAVGAPQNYKLKDFSIAIPIVRVWRINGSEIEGVGINP